jgi:uncharacterized protein (TIGR03066 family)
MKSIANFACRIIFLLFITAFWASAHAELALKDASELIGSWKLNHTSPKIDGKKRPSDQKWEFRSDGTLVSTASDKRTKGTFTVSVPYEIEDGKLVTGVAGRPGKKVSYTLIEKKDNEMILKGGADGFLFFTKQ